MSPRTIANRARIAQEAANGADAAPMTLTLPWALLVRDNARHGLSRGRIVLTARYREALDFARILVGAAMKGRAPLVIPPDPKARLILDRFEAHMRERRRTLRAAKQPAALYVRTAQQAQQLALIVAAGRGADDPVISAEDAEWACALATFLADSMAWRVLSHVSENQVERNVKRLAEVIRGAGGAGLTKSDLTRATQGMTSNVRNDALTTLTDSGQVFAKAEAGKTRSTHRYWWCTYAPDAEADPNTSNTSNLSLAVA